MQLWCWTEFLLDYFIKQIAAGISVAAGKFLGVLRIFAKFPQTRPKNTPKKMTTKKKKKNKNTTAFLFMLGAFFQIKALQASFWPKFSPKFSLTCPKRAK